MKQTSATKKMRCVYAIKKIMHSIPNSTETEQQYEDALSRVFLLMQINIEQDSKESNELELLSKLIKEHEQEHYSIPKR